MICNNTIATPARIENITSIGSHNIEVLSDGRVDICHSANILNPEEYASLNRDEAYKLLLVLQELFK
jgi:hypothetical protein